MDESTEGGDGKAILVPDFLQANDWKFSRFAALVLTLQAIVLLLIFLDGYGLVPLYLRELVTFLFYSYVPGLVLLRVLRMHRLGAVLTTILSVAASVVILMFTGFSLNLCYLVMNGPMPFTLAITTLGQTVILLLLLALALIIDRRYSRDLMLDISPLLSAPAFALYSLPLVAVLATYLLNGWNSALLQIILLLMIAAVLLTLVIVRVPSHLYPVAVICIALAVLFHTSLVSRFVVEWADISFEFGSANRTLLSGFWSMTAMDHRTDSVLSVTILAPMYVLLTGLDLNIILKVCYPVLLTFIPLGVFSIARSLIGSRGALLAAFLIISGTVFFTEFLGLARQIVAELLLVAISALLLYRTTVPINRTLLAWFLALGMIVSHYGVVAVVIPAAIASALLFLLLEWRAVTLGIAVKVIGSAALLLAPPILWYSNVSGSAVFIGIMGHFEQLMDSNSSVELASDLIPTLLFKGGIPLHIWLAVVSAIMACMLFTYGIIQIIASRRPLDGSDRTYLAIAAPFMAYTFLVFLDTDLFNFISRGRLFHICLLFTAPLVIYGGICALRALNKRPLGFMKKPSIVALASILTVIFLGNSGVISQAIGPTTHIELDMNIIDVPRHSDGTYLAANFTVEKGESASTIFADAHRAYILDMLGGRYNPLYGREGPPISKGTNIHYFFSSENLDGMLWLENPDYYRINKNYVPMGEPFSNMLLTIDKVYSSQESELYYKKF